MVLLDPDADCGSTFMLSQMNHSDMSAATFFFRQEGRKKSLKDKGEKIKRFPKVARQRFSYHGAVRF